MNTALKQAKAQKGGKLTVAEVRAIRSVAAVDFDETREIEQQRIEQDGRRARQAQLDELHDGPDSISHVASANFWAGIRRLATQGGCSQRGHHAGDREMRRLHQLCGHVPQQVARCLADKRHR